MTNDFCYGFWKKQKFNQAGSSKVGINEGSTKQNHRPPSIGNKLQSFALNKKEWLFNNLSSHK